jgi:hypothetical protein
MLKRARITSFRIKKALVGSALLSLCASHHAYTQDGGINTQSLNNTNVSTKSEQALLATNFAARWGDELGATKEFVLGSDGVVKDARTAETVQNPQQPTNSNVSKIGADTSAYFHLMEEEKASPVPGRPTGSLSQIGVVRPEEQQISGVAKCGPSPLSPDEIKALVVSTAKKHGVDEGFATAIAWAESRFDQDRNSPKGARGPMQLIPGTAERFGVADVCDPAQNIEGGVKYLRFLLDEFQNPLLVAAAYNSGENRIYEYGGVPPFQETVGYVAKVVNFQLGLPMPSGKRKAGNVVRDVAATNSDGGAGVIAVQKSGKFVGGVMHF